MVQGLILSAELADDDVARVIEAGRGLGAEIVHRPVEDHAGFLAALDEFPQASFMLADFLPDARVDADSGVSYAFSRVAGGRGAAAGRPRDGAAAGGRRALDPARRGGREPGGCQLRLARGPVDRRHDRQRPAERLDGPVRHRGDPRSRSRVLPAGDVPSGPRLVGPAAVPEPGPRRQDAGSAWVWRRRRAALPESPTPWGCA